MQAKYFTWCSGKETESIPKLEEKLVVLNFLRDSTSFNVEPSEGVFKGNIDYTRFKLAQEIWNPTWSELRLYLNAHIS